MNFILTHKKAIYKIFYTLSFGATIAFVFGCSSVGPAQSALLSRWVITLIMTATSIYLANCVQVAGDVSASGSATTGGGNGGTDTTPPAAPTAPSAVATGTSVALSWTNPATDYSSTVILVSTVATPSSPTSGTPVFTGAGTSFTDTVIADGSTYYYAIFTLDSAGNYSTTAATITATTVDLTPPSSPTLFTATALNGGSVNLSWVNPVTADFAGVAILRKTTGYATSINDATATTIYTGTGAFFTDNLTASGTQYFYSIFAFDNALTPNYSASANATATPVDSVAPALVTSLLATPFPAGNQVDLSWVNPTAADFAGVLVLRKTGTYPASSVDPVAIQVYNGPAAATSDIGLTNGTIYYYSVFSYDLSSNYSLGAQITATPSDTAAPGTPTPFTAISQTSGLAIDLNWTNPAALDFAGVKLLRKTGGYATGVNDATATLLYSGTLNTFTDNSVTRGTQYFYSIYAFDAATVINYSAPGTAAVTATDTLPPAAPAAFAASINPAGYQLDLSWTNPTDADFSGVKLLRKTGGFPSGPNDTTAATLLNGAGTTFADTNLTLGTTCFYALYAFDATGNFSVAAQTSAAPADTTAPGPVTGLSATVLSMSSVQLTWTNPADAHFGTAKVLRTTGAFAAGPTDATATVVINSNVATVTDTLLAKDTTYYYSVYAYDAAGNVSIVAQITAYTDGRWSQDAYLKASNAQANDNFGGSVTISGDLMAVAAINESNSYTTIQNTDNFAFSFNPNLAPTTLAGANDNAWASNSGAVYVFKRDPVTGTFRQDAYLKATNAEAFDNFGSSVTISGDLIAIGAQNEDNSNTTIQNTDNALPATNNNLRTSAGAVYVFKRDPATGNWSQDAYLKATNAGTRDYFGISVSISGDLIAVGAKGEGNAYTAIQNIDNAVPAYDYTTLPAFPIGANSIYSGAVYVFKRDPVTTNWSQDAYLKGTIANTAYDYFGQSVSISGDLIAVGVPGDDYGYTTILNLDNTPAPNRWTRNNYINAGSVFVFKRDPVTTNWSQDAMLLPRNGENRDAFGTSVAIAGDFIAVGAHLEDNSNTAIQNTDNALPVADNFAASASGAVYVFKRDPATTNWSQDAYLKATNAQTNDNFGRSVAISGDLIAVGAPYEDNSNTAIQNADNALPALDDALAYSSGAVYIFKCDVSAGSPTPGNWSQDAYLKASNAGAGDQFGRSVSLSGDLIAVGAQYEDNSNTAIQNADNPGAFADTLYASNAGAVYIFKRQ